MNFDELLGLDDIDAEEMVLVVGGALIGVENNGGNVFGTDTTVFQLQIDDGLKNNWMWVYGS